MATANPDIQSLRKDMLSLPTSTRALLAQELLESLDGAGTAEVDAAWAEEAERRHAEMKSGKVKCIPGDEVLKRVRNRKK
jgi:putative addiction module component (TIGR02574 family)